MKNVVVIENSKTRGKYQFFWYFCMLFFFFGSLGFIAGEIIWFDISNTIPFAGFFVPIFFLFSALLFFFLFIVSLLLTWRHILLSENDIIVFTGFGRYKIRCDERIQIVFALIGNGAQSTCGCLIFKDKLKVCEYQMSMGDSGKRETQLIIEKKMNQFANKTQCSVCYKWFVPIKEVMRELKLKNKRIKKKLINK